MMDPTAPAISHRRKALAVGLILLVALGVRVAVVESASHFHPETDALDYDRHAVALVTDHRFAPPLIVVGGGPKSAFRPPLFPLTLAGVYELSGTANADRRWEAGLWFETVLGTLVVGLTMLLAWLTVGELVAVIAGAIGAVFPPLLLAGASLMSENLFVALELGAVCALLWRGRSPHSLRWVLLAGALVGLAALTRPNGLALLAPLGVAVWTGRPRISRKALLAPALLVMAAVLTIAPWTVRNAIVMDSFVPISTQAGFGVAGQYAPEVQNGHPPAIWRPPYEFPAFRSMFLHKPPVGEVEVDRRLRAAARRYVVDHPISPVRVAFWSTTRVLAFDGVARERYYARAIGASTRLGEVSVYAFLLLLPFSLAGAFTAAARRVPRWIWLVPVTVLLSVIFVNGYTRYRAPMDPYFVLLAACALSVLVTRWRDARARA